MPIRKILRNDGTTAEAQAVIDPALYNAGKVSPHLTFEEVAVRDGGGNEQNADFTLSEKLIEAFELLRTARGKAIPINSGWRSAEKQAELLADPAYKAATYSPHIEGLALDLGADSADEVDLLVDLLRKLRKSIPLRIGFQQYRDNGQTFVHFDVAPFYYGIGGPLAARPCPDQWREPSEW